MVNHISNLRNSVFSGGMNYILKYYLDELKVSIHVKIHGTYCFVFQGVKFSDLQRKFKKEIL